MHNQMQMAEDYAKDLAKYYIAASRHLQSEQNAILRRFALTHHMTIKEAEELISSLKDPSSIKELIKALKKDPKNAELVKEFEAQAARSRIMRLNALQSQVTYTAGQIQVLLNKKAQKLFVNLARSAYYNTMFDAMQRAGYGFNVKMLDPKRIKRVMDRSWTGAGFSKRLWSNTKALEDAVKREIMVNLLTGRPLIKASQAINEEFGKGYNNARRLIRTESAYITNQMTLEGYKDLEADKYIYVAILDLKTSEVCRGLDKKRFLVKSAKVGVNYPPMHPWCRSTTIPWMPDSLLKNMKQRALDPKTGKHVLVPGDMTYEQWYKQFVQGQPAGDSTTQTIAAGSRTVTNTITSGSNTTTFANAPGTNTSSIGASNFYSVKDEYYENAKPREGKFDAPEDREFKNREKENMELIYDNFGGDIEALKELNSQKNPDYRWKGRFWEEKEPIAFTLNAIDRSTHTAVKQIRENPGGIVLDIGKSDMPINVVKSKVYERLRGSANFDCDVMVIRGGQIEDIFRYESIKK